MRIFLLIIFAAFISIISQAQFYFGASDTIISGGTDYYPHSVISADLDGDEDMDVVVADDWDNKVVWYENIDGLGTFGLQKIITTSVDRPKNVCSGDLDNDGDIDVLSASSFDDKIAWYENMDGAGTFGEQQIITESSIGKLVVVADIDGDDDLDVLTASGTEEVSWYENIDGNGNFGEPQIITNMVDNVLCIHTADIDGDNDQDVIIASHGNNKLAWYENMDGLGNFGNEYVVSTYNDPTSVFAADFDNDNDLDLVAHIGLPNYIVWYENLNGSGNFGSVNSIDHPYGILVNVYAADLDSDEDMDILATSDDENKVSWYENTDGNGDFSIEHVISTIAFDTRSACIDDFDGDDDLDVAYASYDSHMVAWHKNADGNGNFGGQNNITKSVMAMYSVHTADVNGDGDLDVLSASGSDRKVSWFQNMDGQGSFGEQKNISVTANVARGVYSSDLDGDEDTDVLSVASGNNKIMWYENTGEGESFVAEEIGSSNWPYSVYAADLDGDTDKDVLVASNNDDKILWFENLDGNGSFGTQHIITYVAGGANSATAADLDGDNDLDVVAALGDYHDIVWYENTDGNGNFGTAQMITNSLDFAKSVITADVDGDSDQDVIAGGSFEIVWIENIDGNGEFGPPQIITESVHVVWSIYAVDLDKDGDMDLLSASNFDDKIAWYENIDGLGTFGIQNVISESADNARSVYAADFDNDGDNDILYGAGNTIAWNENFSNIEIIGQPVNQDVCPNSNPSFYFIAYNVEYFQWQVNDGSGFENVYNNGLYAGAQSDSLQINGATGDMSGYHYRCYISNQIDELYSDTGILIVEDLENPEIISTHEDQILDADENCQAILADFANEVIAIDNCDTELEITQFPTPGSIIEGDMNEVTLTVTDDENNFVEVSINVEVVDSTDPSILCVDDQIIDLPEGEISYTVEGTEFDPISIEDNCGVDSVINNFNNATSLQGAVFPMDTTTVFWAAIDNAGNESDCSFNVIVNKFVGIGELKQNGISIFPNPTTGKIHLEFGKTIIQQIRISNMKGEAIVEKTEINQNEMIDMSPFNNGVYTLIIQTTEKIITTKIVKN